jgi:hypothetical protein
MRNPDRIKKTNHIANLYPNIIHYLADGAEHPICNTSQGKNVTQDSAKVTCNSCKSRIKRK